VQVHGLIVQNKAKADMVAQDCIIRLHEGLETAFRRLGHSRRHLYTVASFKRVWLGVHRASRRADSQWIYSVYEDACTPCKPID